MLFAGALAALLLASAYASPTKRDLVVHERRDTAPPSFVHSGAAPADQTLNLRINLASNNLVGLEEALNGASEPTSASYGQWLSKEEVESYTRPSADTVAAVNQWLSENSLTSRPISAAGDWIQFSVPVSKANEMLNADFSVYTHKSSGQQSIRSLQYSIPSSLQRHIELIHPITSFTPPLRNRPVVSAPRPLPPRDVSPDAKIPASCNTTITPACLQSLYGIPTTAATNKKNSIGVAAFDEEYANEADLKMFLKQYRPDMPSTTSFGLTTFDMGTNEQTEYSAGTEANLDIQYTVGLATGVPVTFVSVGWETEDGDDDGFLDIITGLLNETAPPQVLTTSYGFSVETDLSYALTNALCNQYMALTSRGVSILFASGDGGVSATPGQDCDASQFLATFPTCPFVTLVGATANVPETGAGLSAGGFSNYFPTASWQQNAVAGYIKELGSTYKGAYNASGRGYPDVSAQGQSVGIVVYQAGSIVDGTSCSSPIFASVIGLLNDQLMNKKKPVLGFLNPWLYANPGMFNDITTGSNPGCDTNGFPALKGWDPVTGLGTPNFAKMKAAAGL